MATTPIRRDPIETIGAGRVAIQGSFRPNGASGIVAGSTVGKGFSVARTSAGLYTITLQSVYQKLIKSNPGVRVADTVPTITQLGDYVAGSKTLQLRVFRAATGVDTLTKPAGFYPLDIANAREIFTNDIGVAATGVAQGSGGILCSDTTPILQRANGATDKSLRISWAATVVDEVQFSPLIKPPELDGAAALVVHLLVSKGSNTDTAATIDVQVFDGVGDTECGAATAALATASLTEYTASVSAADLGEYPGFLNIALIPSAHANDAIYLHGAWVEFTRKTWASTTTGQVFSLADLAADVDNVVNFEAVFGMYDWS